MSNGTVETLDEPHKRWSGVQDPEHQIEACLAKGNVLERSVGFVVQDLSTAVVERGG